MKRPLQSTLGAVMFGLCVHAQSAIVFSNTGTGAPPTSLGSYTMQPFNQAAQAALADYSSTSTVPGNPMAGTLTNSITLDKRTVPGSWGTWSHGYTGPIFFTGVGVTSTTLTLPANAGAFYVYVEPDNTGPFTVTATTNGGGTSGPVSVSGGSGATGFGFYTTAGETLTSLTITTDAGAGGFAIGEFGIAASRPAPESAVTAVPTLSEWMLLLAGAALAASAVGALRRGQRP